MVWLGLEFAWGKLVVAHEGRNWVVVRAGFVQVGIVGAAFVQAARVLVPVDVALVFVHVSFDQTAFDLVALAQVEIAQVSFAFVALALVEMVVSAHALVFVHVSFGQTASALVALVEIAFSAQNSLASLSKLPDLAWNSDNTATEAYLEVSLVVDQPESKQPLHMMAKPSLQLSLCSSAYMVSSRGAHCFPSAGVVSAKFVLELFELLSGLSDGKLV